MSPSNACHTCKARRIKCDESLPTCLRCIKSRRECVRPTSPALAIVSENKYAAGSTKRPRGPRLRRGPTAASLTEDIHAKALNYYFENNAVPPIELEVDIYGSLSSCIFTWKNSGHSSKMVDLALLSMALAVYARTQSSPPAAAEAFKSYHELLKLLQEQIARPTLDAVSINACLLTVFLMGRCESTMHNTEHLDNEDAFNGIKSWSHHDGAMSLLKLWHMHFRDEPTSMIVKQTRRGILKSLLLRRLSVPKWLREGDDFGEQGLELDYDRILARLVNVRSAMSIEQTVTGKSFREIWLEEGTKLARDLYEFKDRLPETYQHQEYEITCSDQQWCLTSTVIVYSTPAHSTMWAHIFATRLAILYTNVALLRHSPGMVEEAEACSMLLEQNVRNLAATVPQCLGLVDVDNGEVKISTEASIKPSRGSSVVWPLTIAVSIEGYDKALQQGFKSQLLRLGEIIGDGVLQSVSSDEWPSL